jgi:transporter family-2 protein
MSFLLLLPLAFIGGMAVPAQFAVNSQLKNVVGGTFSAAAVSFIVGAVALSLGALVVSRTVPQFSEMAGAPWWVWTGGLLGAFYVLCSILLTPVLGAAATVGFFLAGQLAASVAIDHFGLLGVSASEVTPPRILGLLLVLCGALLIQRF